MSTVDRHRWLAVNFAATIFVSAFLLFQVQPLVSKCILPWFGGTPAVWTTCMLFFQTLLFLGYAYAHFSAQRLSPRAQAIVHLALIVLALVFLRVVPSEAWKPMDSDAARAANLGAVGGDGGAAVLRAIVDGATATGLVRADVCESDAVSVVRAVERGVVAGAAQLSVLFRAEVRYSAPGNDLDGGVCGLRSAMWLRGRGTLDDV